MPHSISAKVLSASEDSVKVEVSGSFDAIRTRAGNAYPGLPVVTLAEVAKSLAYLIDYGFRQTVADAGAAPKGTKEADRVAAMRERIEKLRAGYTGSEGRGLPAWVRIAAARVAKVAPEDAKPGDVHQALMREDGKYWATAARTRKLNPAKVAAFISESVAWAKAEAARRAEADAEGVDLGDLA